MRSMTLGMSAAIFILALCALGGAARAADPHPNGLVGTTFPADFPRIIDASLGVPVIGFGGSQGRVERVPVIFLHGNNDTPFPTPCNPFGYIHNLAQFFLDAGYRSRELWGLGYQGDQCDLITAPTNRSGFAHSTEANVPDLRAFVRAVLAYTGAEQVDIVAHSLGVTLTREWMRQDHAFRRVRALVAIDGPNHGIINCSPSPLNYFQLPSLGGFTPDSAVCREYGSDHTPLLTALNRGREARGLRATRRDEPGVPGHRPGAPGSRHAAQSRLVSAGGAPAFRRCRRAAPPPWRRRTRRAPRRRARARPGTCLARLAAASERAQPIGLHG